MWSARREVMLGARCAAPHRRVAPAGDTDDARHRRRRRESRPTRRWSSPPADEAPEDERSGNFERLVRRNAWLFPQPELDADTAALDAFWLSKGITEEHERKALISMGRDIANDVAARMLYGEPDALGHALNRLEAIFPSDTNVAKMLWQCPEVLQLPLSEIAQRLIAFKRAFPKMDATLLLHANPRALLLDNLPDVSLALDELQRDFPRVDMQRVITLEPHVIQAELPDRVRVLRALDPALRPPSLAAFYPDVARRDVNSPADIKPPMSNAQLFAKVFLLVTESAARESTT